MRISEVSEHSGIPATTLRFYESIGLLPAERTPAGYRDYDGGALDRLGVIIAAKRLGLTLDDIAELLDVWTGGTCAQTKRDLAPRLRARLDDTRREATDLQSREQALTAALAHLGAMPDCDQPCGPECVLPEGCCSLGPEDRERRVAEWRSVLKDLDTATLPDGLRATVPPERFAQVATLVAAERECCPFLDFRLDLEVRWA